jgi:hypothetical protein
MRDKALFYELQTGVHFVRFLEGSEGSLRYVASLKSIRLVSSYSEAIDPVIF